MVPKRIAFTKVFIDALEPPKTGRLCLYDAKVQGLAVRVTTTGAKTFVLYRKRAGRPERIRICAWPELTIEQIRKQAQALIGRIAQGADPQAERRAIRKTWTLDELFSHYLETHAKPRKKTWAADEANFKRYFGEWKNKRLDQISRRDVAAFHAKVGVDVGHTTANRMVALLSKMFSEAAKAGYEVLNPCKGITRFKERSKERFITAGELPKLFKAIEAEPDTLLADAVLLALFTGARRGNVLSARWAEIDIPAAVWVIPAGKSKGGRAIDVPLGVPAIEVLERRRNLANGSEYVFPSRGKTGHLVEIKAVWKRICDAAGLQGVRFHDLRHSYASWAVAAGVPLFTLGKALGHASTATTQRYAHLERHTVLAASQATTNAMLAVIKSAKAEPAPTKPATAKPKGAK